MPARTTACALTLSGSCNHKKYPPLGGATVASSVVSSSPAANNAGDGNPATVTLEVSGSHTDATVLATDVTRSGQSGQFDVVAAVALTGTTVDRFGAAVAGAGTTLSLLIWFKFGAPIKPMAVMISSVKRSNARTNASSPPAASASAS